VNKCHLSGTPDGDEESLLTIQPEIDTPRFDIARDFRLLGNIVVLDNPGPIAREGFYFRLPHHWITHEGFWHADGKLIVTPRPTWDMPVSLPRVPLCLRSYNRPGPSNWPSRPRAWAIQGARQAAPGPPHTHGARDPGVHRLQKASESGHAGVGARSAAL
jgi:hypothetical protein